MLISSVGREPGEGQELGSLVIPDKKEILIPRATWQRFKEDPDFEGLFFEGLGHLKPTIVKPFTNSIAIAIGSFPTGETAQLNVHDRPSVFKRLGAVIVHGHASHLEGVMFMPPRADFK